MTAGRPRIERRDPGATPDRWPANIHPVLRRVYRGRGIAGPEDLGRSLADLADPALLGGLDAACALLAEAMDRGQRIRVIGDFDCDGATGAATAVLGLRMLGAGDVEARVPHRLRHGYGLSPALVAELAYESPDLLVTVDSGIACHEGVAAARAAGVRVIVTDHHLPGERLPAADAIVDPNLPGDGFPSRALAGVGVVFYLLLALRARLREQGRFGDGQGPDLRELLDLVAVGTVADMVPLDRNNRVLVAAGLRRMRAGLMRPGLLALAQVAGRDPARLDAGDIGFAIAPRLNAAGRLEDMAIGVRCLLAEDPCEANALARELDAINRERRERQADMLVEAERLAAAALPDGDALAPVVCVYGADWHPGVVGLVASRLKDRLHRPVLAFAPGGDDGLLRGSARSIPGLHVRDALADVAARHPGLVPRFGGHAMAAGLSLPLDSLAAFEAALREVVVERLDPAALLQRVASDGPLDPADRSRAVAEALREAGPWGQGFPEPLFDQAFEVLDWREVGRGHLRMRVDAGDGGPPVDAIEFGGLDGGGAPGARVHLAYQLGLDDYNGRRGVQLVVRHRFGA